MTERQVFSAEFKREAVRLLESGDRKAAALARDLGVRRNLLYKWRDEIRSKGDDAFSRKPERRRGQVLHCHIRQLN